MELVFFGSGPVAASSLESLAQRFKVRFVVTKASAPRHKTTAQVELIANKYKLRLVFANTKSELDEILTHEGETYQLGVVVDYGVIISAQIIAKFGLGIINSHFSILPEWRGADPISFSILSGDRNN